MSELWLPANRLSRFGISAIEPGRLLVLPPAGAGEDSARIGIKLNVEGAQLVLALTPFYGEGSAAGDAVDLSVERETALTLDATLSVEVNLVADAVRGSRRDVAAGELVDTDDGLGIGTCFNRHRSGHRTFTRAVSVSGWSPLDADSSRVIFGDWRLRIDMDGYRPIYWKLDRSGKTSAEV